MFILPKLPYSKDALAPHISTQTMALHHGKHHKAYIDKLNDLLDGTDMAELPLAEVIQKTAGVSKHQAIFNNAAQCWNHDFFWKSMKPAGGGKPNGAVAALISKHIGGQSAFNAAFLEAATTHFGSGWAWLVLVDSVVEIITTHDADLPPIHGRTALIACDLWEHAYYLDYQNRRPEFVQTFLDHLVNWDFTNANLARAETQLANAA